MSYLTNAEFCPAAPSLTQQLLHYRHPIGTRALFELGVTVGLLGMSIGMVLLMAAPIMAADGSDRKSVV